MPTIVVYILLVLVFLKLIFKFYHWPFLGVECLIGKVAIVTGGNKGIGLEVAKLLASRGCKVIIACRSKADNERKNIVEDTHNENIVVKHLDLRSFESVRSFAKDIHKTEKKIDILINNAGIAVHHGLTGDGLHPVVQTNALSPFLLTHLLCDLLRMSDDGRIIFSSSVLAFYENLSADNLNPNADGKSTTLSNYFYTYGNTKLLQVLISNIFSEKLRKYKIKSNAIHPGMINSNIWNDFELPISLTLSEIIFKWLTYIFVFFYSRTTREGAESIVNLAAADDFKDTTGQFYWSFGMRNFYPRPKCLNDEAFCQTIWKKMEVLAKLKADELLK